MVALLPSKLKNVLANADNRDLLISSAFAFVIRVFGAISGFAATFFIARHLGAAESGYYFLAFSIITVISAFSRVGLDNTVLRFTGSAPDLAVNTTLKSLLLILSLSLIHI